MFIQVLVTEYFISSTFPAAGGTQSLLYARGVSCCRRLSPVKTATESNGIIGHGRAANIRVHSSAVLHVNVPDLEEAITLDLIAGSIHSIASSSISCFYRFIRVLCFEIYFLFFNKLGCKQYYVFFSSYIEIINVSVSLNRSHFHRFKCFFFKKNFHCFNAYV